jgi:hypothetical protein
MAIQSIVKQLKGNYSLIPLVGVLGFGVFLCSFSSFRTLFKSPDVVFNKKNDQYVTYDQFINEDGTAKQYKYFSRHDFSKIKVIDEERPKI